MIGCFNCPITGVRLQPSDYSQLSHHTVQLHLYRVIVKYKAAGAPIKFVEIVTIMISLVITVAGFSLGSGTTSVQQFDEIQDQRILSLRLSVTLPSLTII